MEGYRRLSFGEREEISRGMAAVEGCRAVARRLGRSPSTVSREVRRSGLTRCTYRAAWAHRAARAARRTARRPRKLDVHRKLRKYVLSMLRARWSPEQIARRLERDHPFKWDWRVYHEAIYRYLYVLPRGELKRELVCALRQGHMQRRTRRKGQDGRGTIPDMLSIEERPAIVADRTVPGHWEGDLLVGRRGASALGTLVERTTRTTLLVPLTGRDPRTVRRAFARELKSLPRQLAQSLTYDQGKEMMQHRFLTQETQVQVYFAHPHSPWERGTNENTNGLIRQFFPKGTDFSKVSRAQIKHVQHLLNGRPRAVLDYRTPSEVFREIIVALPT